MFNKTRMELAQGAAGGGDKKNPGALVAGGVIALAAAGLIGYQVLKKGQGADAPAGDSGQETQASSGTGQTIELDMWDQEEAENTAVIDSWIARFQEENPNIKITRQTYPNEDLRTKFTTAATAGQAAELVWGPNDVAGVFNTAGIIQPVDALVDLSKFTPLAADAAKIGGKPMGIPVTYGNHLVLIYNKSMVPKAPATTDELIAEAKKFTNEAEKKHGLVFFQNEPFWLVPFMGSFGAWPLTQGSDGSVSLQLNSKGTEQALAFVRDLKFKDKIIPSECDYDCAKGLFLEEKAAFTINGDWSIKEFQAKLGDKVGVAPLPVNSQTNQPMTPMVSGRYVFVPAQIAPEKLEAVKKFVTFLASKPVQIEVATRLGRVPATFEATQDSAVTSLPNVQALIDAAKNGRPMPAESEMRAAWDAMRPVQQKVLAGELQPADAVAVMQDSAVEKLASLKK